MRPIALPLTHTVYEVGLRTRNFCMVAVFMVLACASKSGIGSESINLNLVPIDFKHLQRRSSPNDYLVCPPNLCQNAKLDRTARLFPIPATELRKRIESLLAGLPRIRIVKKDATQLVIEQHSAVFGFPDIIDIRVIDIEAARSTLAIYSRSQYGYYDFGANKWRVEMWLKELVGTLTE